MERFTSGIGMDDERESQPINILVDAGDRGRQMTLEIVSTARDSGNTPTTTLRAGLCMGKVSATGLWKEYNNAASDGSEVCRTVLLKEVNLLNQAGSAANAMGVGHFGGFYDDELLQGFNTSAKTDLEGRAGGFSIFKEDHQGQP